MNKQLNELVYRGTLALQDFIIRQGEPLDGDAVDAVVEEVRELLNQFNGNE